MYTIRYDHKTGKIKFVSLIDEPREGDLVLKEIPTPPQKEEYIYEMRVKDGAIVFDEVKVEMPPQEPTEPTYEETTPPTNEEISQMRQTAYEAECDSLLIAWMGYTAEGDTEKAESARKAYLRAKAEVRKRLPYTDTAEEEVVIPLSRDDDLL